MKLYKLNDTPLPNELRQTFARISTINENSLPYKRIAKGQYKIYCPYCQVYKDVDYPTFKKIRADKKCPNCGEQFRNTTQKDSKEYKDYISIDIDGKSLGYHVVSKWEFEKPIEVVSIRQFAIFDPNGDVYVKPGYALGGMGTCISNNPDYDLGDNVYRKACSPKYSWHTTDYYLLWTWRYGSRYDRKKIMQDIYGITKSNQQTMLLDRKFETSDVCYAIALFDINSPDIIEKYADYLSRNSTHLKDFRNEKLNVYYLDYLNRHNIDLGDYFTYLQNLKRLGLPYDKPTDFNNRYEKIEDMVSSEDDSKLNELVTKRLESLPVYEDGNVKISPFKRVQDIRRCGKKLHNCIGGYAERYAKGSTDLYHLDLDKAITIAIEISNNKLKQAYGDHNHKCPDDLFKHIETFCNINKINLGSYATR